MRDVGGVILWVMGISVAMSVWCLWLLFGR
jgi:hypothetical protein